MAKKPKPDTSRLDPALKDDPRVRDPMILNRMKLMVENEALHPAWVDVMGCWWRLGRITTAEWMAGNEYERLVLERRAIEEIDLDAMSPELADRAKSYISRIKGIWNDLYKEITDQEDGVFVKRALDSLLLEKQRPVNTLLAFQGLRWLSAFFSL